MSNIGPAIEIWQEYDCPNQGMDIDLHGEAIVCVGEEFHCCICGGTHIATIDFPDRTYIKIGESVGSRGIPIDQAEKAAWLAEFSK